jgi:hypothetical protein
MITNVLWQPHRVVTRRIPSATDHPLGSLQCKAHRAVTSIREAARHWTATGGHAFALGHTTEPRRLAVEAFELRGNTSCVIDASYYSSVVVEATIYATIYATIFATISVRRVAEAARVEGLWQHTEVNGRP